MAQIIDPVAVKKRSLADAEGQFALANTDAANALRAKEVREKAVAEMLHNPDTTAEEHDAAKRSVSIAVSAVELTTVRRDGAAEKVRECAAAVAAAQGVAAQAVQTERDEVMRLGVAAFVAELASASERLVALGADGLEIAVVKRNRAYGASLDTCRVYDVPVYLGVAAPPCPPDATPDAIAARAAGMAQLAGMAAGFAAGEKERHALHYSTR